MRCGRAHRLMTAAVDRELAAGEREALDGHLAGCPACEREMRSTTALLRALASLPGEAGVPPRLEQETLRRVRLAADEPPVRAGWRRWLPLPLPLPALVLAAAAVAALSVGLLRQAGDAPV